MTAITAAAINIQPSVQQYSASRKSSVTVVAPEAALVEQVCDLIDAAGPLSIEHIAGGLNLPTAQASSCVGLMVTRDWLREDEFARYRLWGSRAR
jgi:hypothetical protein